MSLLVGDAKLKLPLPHAAAALSINVIYMQGTHLFIKQVDRVKTLGFQALNIPESETLYFCQNELACTVSEQTVLGCELVQGHQAHRPKHHFKH